MAPFIDESPPRRRGGASRPWTHSQTLRALAGAGAQVRNAIDPRRGGAVSSGWPAVNGPGRCSWRRRRLGAVVADVLELLAEPGSPVPVSVRRNLPLPGWVGPLDLVIAVSQSGRAEGPVAWPPRRPAAGRCS